MVSKCLKRALIITIGAALLAWAFNGLRGEGGIPLFAQYPYEIFVPCPDARAEVEPVTVEDVPEAGVIFIDARPEARFKRGHVPEARSLPYDDLFDPPEAEIKALIQLKAQMIVVYGELDGALDTGQRMAEDLAASGLRGARPLEGGVEAWAASGRPFKGLLGGEDIPNAATE